MKLKRTVALIMGTVLSMASLAGCSQTTLNYGEELEKTAKWEATSSEVTGKISMDIQGMKEEMNFTSTGYTTGDKAYAKVDFTTSESSLNIKIPSIEVYVDNGVSYINKSYYEGIYTNSGLEVPKGLKDLKADYIGIDTGMDMAAMKALTNEPEAMANLIKTVFGDSDIDLPYVQNGREYTMNLNSNEVVDLAAKGVKAASNNLQNINNTFKLGLTDADMSQIKDQINSEAFTSGLEGIKQYIAGSNITSKEVFGDDKYTTDLGLNLIIKDLGNISLNVTGTSTKAEAKDITIPTNSIKLTQVELQTMLLEDTQNQVTQPSAYSKEVSGLKNLIKPAV